MIKLELLAPAKNYEYGVEAIKCGADALYIGPEMFGARNAASNSIEDIEKLVRYAHIFNVKVYVTFNTVLHEHEIVSAEKLIGQLYNIGVDALIIQDMSICEMNTPPIVLHASTQTAALTPERVKFLEEVGFERIILERAHSLEDMRQIRKASNVELEAFVFGAICVSYSGQCYMSEFVANRSGNRGICAQPCRSTYNLFNEKDELLLKNSHLLSVKDLNLDNSIGDMIKSGIVSFKVEGRLKDIAYLKNSITYFNSILNSEIKKLNKVEFKYKRASNGVVIKGFEANPTKTFTRGFTDYFINGTTNQKIANFQSAKPIGEPLAKVISINGSKISIDRVVEGIGGDGVCYLNTKGELCGAYINRIEGKNITLNKEIETDTGTMLYRNYDKTFSDNVERSKTKRYIPLEISVEFTDKGVNVQGACDEVSLLSICYERDFEVASNIQRAEEFIKSSFSKSGDTVFNVINVKIIGINIRFAPAKIFNEIRRDFLEKLESTISERYVRKDRKTNIKHPSFYDKDVSYNLNVTNKLSQKFFEKCGVKNIEQSIEISRDFVGKELMRMKYCLRQEIGECLKEQGKHKELYIENNGRKFKLNFDCKKCEMWITTIS